MIPSKAMNLTASASTTYNPPLNGVYVGTAGNVVVVMQSGDTVTFKCLAGQYLLGRFTKVLDTSTAADLVGLY
jgi:hypothetical protein